MPKLNPRKRRGGQADPTSPTKPEMPSRRIADPQKSNARASEARDRALKTLRRMRREHISLSKASREEHIKPATVRRYVGNAIRQDRPGGPFRATKGDTFRRDLKIPTTQEVIAVPVYGSKNASLIANYFNAIAEYIRTGKRAKLDSFKGKTVKVDGKNIELITDPAMLEPLAEANLLQFDQLYASAAGRG